MTRPFLAQSSIEINTAAGRPGLAAVFVAGVAVSSISIGRDPALAKKLVDSPHPLA
jgi:hypothetical protein